MQLVEGVRTIEIGPCQTMVVFTMLDHIIMNMWPHLILLIIKYIRAALGYWIQFLVHIMQDIVSIILALGEAKAVCSPLEGCHDLRG
jgi:hypothetical protein